MLNKRAVDAVVATVLIIMITVAAVAIIWMFIIPTIKESITESTAEKAELSIETVGGYTTWDEVQQIARVQVKRGVDNINLTGIDFEFIRQGTSKSKQNYSVPQPGQTKVYEFNLSDFGKPESVAIAAITANGVGQVVSEIWDIRHYSGGSSEGDSSNQDFPQIIMVSGATDNLVQDIENSYVVIGGSVLNFSDLVSMMALSSTEEGGIPQRLYWTTPVYKDGSKILDAGDYGVWRYTPDSFETVFTSTSFSFLPPTKGWLDSSGNSIDLNLQFHPGPATLSTSAFNGDYTYNDTTSKWMNGTTYSIYKEGSSWIMTDGYINYTASDNGLKIPPTNFNYSLYGALASVATVIDMKNCVPSCTDKGCGDSDGCGGICVESCTRCNQDAECPRINGMGSPYCNGSSICISALVAKCMNPGTSQSYCGTTSVKTCTPCSVGCVADTCVECIVDSDCASHMACIDSVCERCPMFSELSCEPPQFVISVYNDPEPGCPTYKGACCGNGFCNVGVENFTNCPVDCP